jgi:hypothetical protein
VSGKPSTIDWVALAGLWALIGAGVLGSRRSGRSSDEFRKPPGLFEGNEIRPRARRAWLVIAGPPVVIAFILDTHARLWWWLACAPAVFVLGLTVVMLYWSAWYARELAPPAERRAVWAVGALFAVALATIPIVVGVVDERWAVAAALALNYLIFNAVRVIAKRTDTADSSS